MPQKLTGAAGRLANIVFGVWKANLDGTTLGAKFATCYVFISTSVLQQAFLQAICHVWLSHALTIVQISLQAAPQNMERATGYCTAGRPPVPALDAVVEVELVVS